MIKLNLIFDGNYLLYKDVFSLKKIRGLEHLRKSLTQNIDKIRKMYPFENVFFVSDHGTSWRKLIYENYKGEREKDKSINWETIYQDYENIKKGLNEHPNINVLEIDSLEGDDIVSYLTDYFNNKGYSNLIIANDLDIQQKLITDIDKNFINIMWNNRYNDLKLFAPKNYKKFLKNLEKNNENDIFSLDKTDDFLNFFDEITKTSKISEVDNEKILICKLIEGDKSDNIPSVIKIKNGELDDTAQGIGKKGAEKCYDIYKELVNDDFLDFKSNKFKEKICESVSIYKKVELDKIKDTLLKNIDFNMKLIYLDNDNIPENLINKLKIKIKNNKKHKKEIIENIKESSKNEEELDDEDDFFNIKNDNNVIDIKNDEFKIVSNNDTFENDDFFDIPSSKETDLVENDFFNNEKTEKNTSIKKEDDSEIDDFWDD